VVICSEQVASTAVTWQERSTCRNKCVGGLSGYIFYGFSARLCSVVSMLSCLAWVLRHLTFPLCLEYAYCSRF
jgi:hypothetical protein